MTLAFLALLGAPYIYDISSLRVKTILTERRRNNRRRNGPNASSFTTKFTCVVPGFKTGLDANCPATKLLSHGNI